MIEVEQRTSATVLVWTVEYDYDAYNRLIRRQADTSGEGVFDEAQSFVYDGTQAVLVFDDADAVTNRLLWGPAVDELFADENELNEVLWSLTDRLGSVRDVAEYDDATGTTSVVNHLEYDAFGNVVSQTDPSKTPLLRFTGRYTDPLTGDQWNWHRWYNARTGRWRSQDPSGLAPDVNPYRYVGNAPANYVDPNGLVPNKRNAIDLDDLVNQIETLESMYPGATPYETLVRLRDLYKGGRGPGFGGSGSTGSGRSQGSAGSCPSDGSNGSPMNAPLGMLPWQYIYTNDLGWIDLPHFFEAARASGSGWPPPVVRFAGGGVEFLQGVQGATVNSDKDGVGSSSYTKEDLRSNRAGAGFGWSVNPYTPLSEAVREGVSRLT